jgi:hypothetical protein
MLSTRLEYLHNNPVKEGFVENQSIGCTAVQEIIVAGKECLMLC